MEAFLIGVEVDGADNNFTRIDQSGIHIHQAGIAVDENVGAVVEHITFVG